MARLPPRKTTRNPGVIFPRKRPGFFAAAPPEETANSKCDLVLISPPKTPELWRFLVAKPPLGFLLATCEDYANLNCGLTHISPLKPPPEPWRIFSAKQPLGFFNGPWRKCKFELRPGAHFAAKNRRDPGRFFRRNYLLVSFLRRLKTMRIRIATWRAFRDLKSPPDTGRFFRRYRLWVSSLRRLELMRIRSAPWYTFCHCEDRQGPGRFFRRVRFSGSPSRRLETTRT